MIFSLSYFAEHRHIAGFFHAERLADFRRVHPQEGIGGALQPDSGVVEVAAVNDGVIRERQNRASKRLQQLLVRAAG